MSDQEFIPHVTWSILMEPDNMTLKLKEFINWCLFNQLPFPRFFRQQNMDINGVSLYDIPYTKYHACNGKAGYKNMYGDFFK
jgi:hypothetical protein